MTTITTVIDPPLPTDTPAVFNTKAFDAWGDINTWAEQANLVADEINTNATTATTKAGEALVSASSASAGATAAQASATSASNSEIATLAAAETVMAASNIDFGAFSLSDGELISVYTDTGVSTPSITDGEFIITY